MQEQHMGSRSTQNAAQTPGIIQRLELLEEFMARFGDRLGQLHARVMGMPAPAAPEGGPVPGLPPMLCRIEGHASRCFAMFQEIDREF